jgi:hypothetical protein
MLSMRAKLETERDRLRTELQQVEAAILVINRVEGNSPSPLAAATDGHHPPSRPRSAHTTTMTTIHHAPARVKGRATKRKAGKHLSMAQRRAISARMKRYWAERRRSKNA